MEMIEIKNSLEYDLFETITGNRNINQKKVDRICQDIQDGLNLLPYCPVMVYEANGKLNLVDGQHRFTVSKKLGLPVYYVVCHEISLQQIATINSKQDKWTAKDFLKCYIKLGNDHYIKLEEILKKYQVQISTAYEMLMQGQPINRKSSEYFKNGTFEVRFLEETIDVLELAKDIFGRYVFTYDRHLLAALLRIQEKGKCNFKILKEKISSAPNLMDKQSTVKNYIYNIERVYNHNNRERQVIF